MSGPVAFAPPDSKLTLATHNPRPLTRPSGRPSRRCAAFTRSQVSFQRSGGRPSSVSSRCSSWGRIGKTKTI